ncbi:MAG: GNAT family N-acetyltransferase [Candidatus Latescibacteria bacterium]|nr:GNAT family N-acetyltransferase [Candidatus Latescibacterota bacterium]
MTERIRTVQPEEWEDFQRFMERCYGHSWNYFPRQYPQLYRVEDDALRGFYVLERDGKVVSHVGLFPLECVAFDGRVMAGGIGGVATQPEDREKGYMSRLLPYVIAQMKDRGYPLSCLGGDRQRYNAFGWEFAGLTYTLTLTRRAMDRAGIRPAEIREFDPVEAAPEMSRFLKILPLRVERQLVLLVLRKPGLRAWLSEDGYVLSNGERAHPVSIMEVASPTGREAELLRAVMERCFGGEATLQVSAFDRERLSRLLRATAWWSAESDWDYRVVDLVGLLEAYRGRLKERAKWVTPFEMSLGLTFSDEIQQATISVQDGKVEIGRGRQVEPYVELDALAGTRLLLGGPSPAQEVEGLSGLLPLPVHVPSLDHV